MERDPGFLWEFHTFSLRHLKPSLAGRFACALDVTYLSCAERLNMSSELSSEKDEVLRKVFSVTWVEAAGSMVLFYHPSSG